MPMPAVLRKFNEGLLHGRAVRNARLALAQRTPAQQLALRQALLLLETGRRVAEPVAELPGGSRPAVLISLYRDAAYWALMAGWTGEGAPPSELGDESSTPTPPGGSPHGLTGMIDVYVLLVSPIWP